MLSACTQSGWAGCPCGGPAAECIVSYSTDQGFIIWSEGAAIPRASTPLTSFTRLPVCHPRASRTRSAPHGDSLAAPDSAMSCAAQTMQPHGCRYTTLEYVRVVMETVAR